MGGFLFNGCGVADTVSKMKLLKNDMCPNCKKPRDFYLAKIRMKIHVVFIPTVPINTKYGIVCAKCKNGRFISEEQMRQIMSADEEMKVRLFDTLMQPDDTESSRTESEIEENPVVQLPEDASNAAASSVCKKCGQPLTGEEAFCGMCGHAVKTAVEEEEPSQEAKTDSKQSTEEKPVRVCPRCQGSVSSNASFCGHCGAALKKNTIPAEESIPVNEVNAADKLEEIPVDEVDAVDKSEEISVDEMNAADKSEEISASVNEMVQAAIEVKDWVCPLCNTLNSADVDHCQLCGETRP